MISIFPHRSTTTVAKKGQSTVDGRWLMQWQARLMNRLKFCRIFDLVTLKEGGTNEHVKLKKNVYELLL